jgi:tetratricopeptide (TPR) repeat protein
VGEFYFKKAIELILSQRFNDAYENIITGYSYLTCDCRRKWFNSEVEKILNDAEYFDCSSFKLDLLKAFIFFYSEQYSKALNSINSFIDFQPTNELGHYFRGNTLIRLEEYSGALIAFKKALSLKKTSKTFYRVGRTKEQHLNEFGLIEMFDAIKINPSSVCAHWHFAEHALKRRLFEPEFKTVQDSYDKEEDIPFRFGYSTAMKFVNEGEKGIMEYLNTMERKLKAFTIPEIDNIENESDDELSTQDDEYLDSYGSSYEKYGGYNGYDDDTIDDSFEGDPLNTWNVD